MKTVTAAEMKEIEKRADATGLSYYQMMENAGNAAYEVIKREAFDIEKMIVFCGKGNNGGDGFVVARLAANEGIDVKVILVEGEPVTEDATKNYNLLPNNVSVIRLENFDTATDKNTKTVIVDAIYGTGFHGELREDGMMACNIINSFKGRIFALDLPSGCIADTKDMAKGSVKADVTIVFDSFKYVHKTNEESCGKCILADIGIPEECHV